MTQTMPEWAMTAGRPDAEKIIKYLQRYGYITEVDGDTHVNGKLYEDYPAVFMLLGNFMMSQMSEKYSKIISDGKVHAYRDEDGKLEYRMDDDVV